MFVFRLILLWKLSLQSMEEISSSGSCVSYCYSFLRVGNFRFSKQILASYKFESVNCTHEIFRDASEFPARISHFGRFARH